MSIFSKKKSDTSEQKISLRSYFKDTFYALRNARIENKSFEENLDENKLRMLKQNKIVFVSVFVPFFISIIIGFFFGIVQWILAVQAFAAVICYMLYKFKFQKISDSKVLLVPVLAFFLSLLFAFFFWLSFAQDVREAGKEYLEKIN